MVKNSANSEVGEGRRKRIKWFVERIAQPQICNRRGQDVEIYNKKGCEYTHIGLNGITKINLHCIFQKKLW